MNNKNKQDFKPVHAHAAELMLSPRFNAVRDEAYVTVEDDGELYAAWRENTDKHLGRLAQVMTAGKDIEQQIWDIQHDIALATLDGEAVGPFSKYFYHASIKGKPIEARPGKGVTVDELQGDYDIVATNNRIVAISRSEEDPLTFLSDSLDYTAERRKRGGARFEAPENYGTALKLFTDKVSETQLEGYEDMERAHSLMNNAMGNFLRVSEKTAPNAIALVNVLVSIRKLPNGLVDKQFSAGILKHTLEKIYEFDENAMNIILGAMSKMDFEECPEAAAMTVDLVLRKGAQMQRSGDMLTALRAVSGLPRSDNSEHAVTTLFDVRNALEFAGDIPELLQMNKLLLGIVENVTDNVHDTNRAKSTAEYIARRAADMLSSETRSRRLNPAQMERLKKQVDTIIFTAKKI